MKFLILCGLLFSDYAAASTGNGDPKWGYRPIEQKLWGVDYPKCNGKRQSPISISTRYTIPIQMPVVEMVGYQNPLAEPISLKNTGKTASLTPSETDPRAKKRGFFRPYIFGGPLVDEYEMQSLHFHWGYRSSHGSEHVINSKRYALEMHIVHKNKKYKDLNEALENADGVVVVAAFFRVVESPTPELSELTEKLDKIRKFNTSCTLDFSLSLSELLSGLDTTRFYTYAGSLTTPPCSESVTWIIYPDALPINMYQMTMFRKMRSEDHFPLVDNYRFAQPLNRRRVFRRMTKNGNSTRINEVTAYEDDENILTEDYDY